MARREALFKPVKREVEGKVSEYSTDVSKRNVRAQVDKLMSEATIEAAKALKRLLESADEKIVLQAATTVLERVYGKPTQTISSDVQGSVTIDLAVEREVRAIILREQMGQVIDVGEAGAKARRAIGAGDNEALVYAADGADVSGETVAGEIS